MRKLVSRRAVAAVAVIFGLAACGGDPTKGSASDADTIAVGSAAFPENEILAEIYAQALESEGFKVEKKMQIGAREGYVKALEAGEIDLVPEYSGNILTYFDPKATATESEEVIADLAKAVPDKLTVLEAAPAENKDSLNVTKKFAAENDVSSIADLAEVKGLRLAANPELKTRAYGLPGMKSKYGITGVKFTPISDGGGPATVNALVKDKVDVADIYSTTPAIAEKGLVTLEDPKNLIAAQNVVPLINADKADDKVTDLLNKISAKLTTDVLLELNAQNQGDDKTAAATVAKNWLDDEGLL